MPFISISIVSVQTTNNLVPFFFSFTHFNIFFNLLEMVQSLHNWVGLTLYSWYPAMIRLFVGHKKELGWQVILLCSTFLLSAHSLLLFFIFTVTNCVEILIFRPEPQKTEDFSFCISFIFLNTSKQACASKVFVKVLL